MDGLLRVPGYQWGLINEEDGDIAGGVALNSRTHSGGKAL